MTVAPLHCLLAFLCAVVLPTVVAAVPPYALETTETYVTAPNGNRLYTRAVQPDRARFAGLHWPALVAIPGGTGAGAPLADNVGYRRLAADGFVVAVFNPEGRGNGLPGNLRSDGTDDCNGFRHQDDLTAVIEYVATLPNVDSGNIGVQTSSFGIAIGAGALGRHPTLPVRYLVDAEGPHDSRVIAFYDAGRERAVCGHLSTATDPAPANEAFWSEREAVRHIGGFAGRYLRMQAEVDHAQNPGYFRHAIEMINAATHTAHGGSGTAVWTRMNGSDTANPANAAFGVDDPATYPQWVTGRLADHPDLALEYVRELALPGISPLSGKRLQVSDRTGDAARRTVSVLSVDPAVVAPLADDHDAPALTGAVLELRNPVTGESATFALPAARWKGRGSPAGSTGYRYSDSRRTSGPCKMVTIKNGKHLEARCSGAQIGFSLDEASQGALAVIMTVGDTTRYCMAFGGTVTADTAGRFKAKDAPAPAECP